MLTQETSRIREFQLPENCASSTPRSDSGRKQKKQGDEQPEGQQTAGRAQIRPPVYFFQFQLHQFHKTSPFISAKHFFSNSSFPAPDNHSYGIPCGCSRRTECPQYPPWRLYRRGCGWIPTKFCLRGPGSRRGCEAPPPQRIQSVHRFIQQQKLWFMQKRPGKWQASDAFHKKRRNRFVI